MKSDHVGNVVEFIFKFNCMSGKCCVIAHDLLPEISRFYFKKYLHAGLQHVKCSCSFK